MSPAPIRSPIPPESYTMLKSRAIVQWASLLLAPYPSLFSRPGHRSVDVTGTGVVDGKPATACVRSLICGHPSRQCRDEKDRSDPIPDNGDACLPAARRRPQTTGAFCDKCQFRAKASGLEHRDFFLRLPRADTRSAEERTEGDTYDAPWGTRELAWVEKRARARAISHAIPDSDRIFLDLSAIAVTRRPEFFLVSLVASRESNAASTDWRRVQCKGHLMKRNKIQHAFRYHVSVSDSGSPVSVSGKQRRKDAPRRNT